MSAKTVPDRTNGVRAPAGKFTQVELRVAAATCNQLVVTAPFDDTAIIQEQDLVGMHQR